jgi:radical SAM superfamily enzyme YgiQ (UPF0313 family)
MTQDSGLGDIGYIADLSSLRAYHYEMGAIRPPSEGGAASLLLRITRNCPWSRCKFCYANMYQHEKFQLRPVEELKEDIDAVKDLAEELKTLSWKLGHAGRMEPLLEILRTGLTSQVFLNTNCIVNVYNWLSAGGKTVFLQDADTPIMPTGQLVEVIVYLRQTFPDIERITSYARSKTIYHKKPEELDQLHRAGLNRLHIGMESGDDEVLKFIDKGVTAEQQIIAGRKAIEAGFELSEYVMPGLAGRRMWQQHAENTARVLNEINPDFIRMRPFNLSKNTPLMEAHLKGELELTSPHERLLEIGLMIKNLDVTSRVCFDHTYNTLYRSGQYYIPLMAQDYNGYKFPEEKGIVLELVNKGLGMDESLLFDVRKNPEALGI